MVRAPGSPRQPHTARRAPQTTADRRRPAAPLVSACLIVKDEEANLPSCLGSLLAGFADEVVVYDTGSSDGTVALARRMGATVVEGFWDDDFARARNAALAHCRGEWIAWLDADETLECDDAAGLRWLLERTKPEIDAWSVAIHNLTGAGEGVAAGFIHHATRLFRRRRCHWAGSLHEQVVRRDGRGAIRRAGLEAAHLRHTGYLEQTWSDRDKTERNLRIAAAQADRDAGSGAALNLARSLTTAERWEEAVPLFRRVVGSSDNPIERRLALRTGAEALVRLGRHGDALDWLGELRRESTSTLQADLTEARIRADLGEFAAAMACLERVGEGGRDADGFTHNRQHLATLRAEVLGGLGRHGEAADELLGALAASGAINGHIGAVVDHLQAAGRSPGELAPVIPEANRPWFMAQVLQMAPAAADEVLEAGLEVAGMATATLATAATLARRLPLERAIVWSARLRAAGLAPSCPLVAVACDSDLPPAERARAAAVAMQMFADERAPGALRSAADDAGPDELAQMALEVQAICPALAGLVAHGAAAAAPAGTAASD